MDTSHIIVLPSQTGFILDDQHVLNPVLFPWTVEIDLKAAKRVRSLVPNTAYFLFQNLDILAHFQQRFSL